MLKLLMLEERETFFLKRPNQFIKLGISYAIETSQDTNLVFKDHTAET
jgi:hypothetical protein